MVISELTLKLNAQGASDALVAVINTMKAASLDMPAFDGDLVEVFIQREDGEATCVATPSPQILRYFADVIERARESDVL